MRMRHGADPAKENKFRFASGGNPRSIAPERPTGFWVAGGARRVIFWICGTILVMLWFKEMVAATGFART